MSRKLTASDRKSLIRLASEMPKGSPERRAILAGLKAAATIKTGQRSPRDWRQDDNTYKIYQIFRKKIRELKKNGWSTSTNITKPSSNTGWPMFVAYLGSPEGESYILRHDGAMWVYDEPVPSNETVGIKHKGKTHKMSEGEFLRNPDKLFAYLG